MSSLTPNAKRRRLDQASTTLSKPFKSPLRRAPPPTSKGDKTPPSKLSTEDKVEDDTTVTQSKAPPRNTQNIGAVNPAHSSIPTAALVGKIDGNGHGLPSPPQTKSSITPARKPLNADPELQALHKHQRTLTTHLATLKSELDTLNQALKIESSSRDSELESLILKWRKVSQDAAEEVFLGAKERVDRMGGMKGWREKMTRDGEFQRGWETEENRGWFGEGGGDGEGDESEIEGGMRGEVERTEVKLGTEDENEEFTMDLMLKTLNIDLKTIGYDKPGQTWIRG
ncbi:hypothetical protein BJY04DRAFT_219437 [Aspergillus karnatakaensis]|uniref:putative DNA repair protein Dds20/Mei5 n=1 Tax=Aspergillus karnatakaensis TaxID=1810916 RepID=UPI003CCE1933